MLLIHCATKLIIKKYNNIKKILIFLKLDVFLDKTKVYIFFNL